MGESARLRHVRPAELSGDTAQTVGMQRKAAISERTTGSRALWMGETVVAARSSSGPHHHGQSETAIFVVSGRPVFRFRAEGREQRIETAPGDYVFVPPHAPHIEENPHDEDALVVIARSTQEAIVENLESL